MYAYFDRDNVALKGFAKYCLLNLQIKLYLWLVVDCCFDYDLLFNLITRFFKDSSEEERTHAEKFMQYQVFLTSVDIFIQSFNVSLYLCCVCIQTVLNCSTN